MDNKVRQGLFQQKVQSAIVEQKKVPKLLLLAYFSDLVNETSPVPPTTPHLPVPETKESWAHFSTDSSKEADTTSMSSETSSMMDDIWAINDEQRLYYTDKFKTMEPDTTGKILGTTALY